LSPFVQDVEPAVARHSPALSESFLSSSDSNEAFVVEPCTTVTPSTTTVPFATASRSRSVKWPVKPGNLLVFLRHSQRAGAFAIPCRSITGPSRLVRVPVTDAVDQVARSAEAAEQQGEEVIVERRLAYGDSVSCPLSAAGQVLLRDEDVVRLYADAREADFRRTIDLWTNASSSRRATRGSCAR
jgi:hypothetical protein